MTERPLRQATAKDADAIATLVDRAYRKYLPRIGRPPAPMTDNYHAVVHDHDVWVVDGPENDVWVVDGPENIARYTRIGFVETRRELRRRSYTVHMRKEFLTES